MLLTFTKDDEYLFINAEDITVYQAQQLYELGYTLSEIEYI